MIRIKYFLTFFGMTFLLVSFSNCGSSQVDKALTLESNPPFTISEISSQKWAAGVQEGGSGTNLRVVFETIQEGVVIEQFYFREAITIAKATSNKPIAYTGFFKNEIKRDIIMDENPVNEAKNTPPEVFPFNLKEGEVVIGYSIEGETKYFRISNIVEKSLIAYPSANPNGRN